MSKRLIHVCLLFGGRFASAGRSERPRYWPLRGATHASRSMLGGLSLPATGSLSEARRQACSAVTSRRPAMRIPTGSARVRGRDRGDVRRPQRPPWAYAVFSPPFHAEVATRRDALRRWPVLGRPRRRILSNRPRGPFLNPKEMHNPDKWAVVRDAKTSITRPPSAALRPDSFRPECRPHLRQRRPAIAAYEASRP